MADNAGNLFNTKIPAYADSADIQAALKLFLYGSYDYDTANTDPTELPNPSLAKHLQDLRDDLTTVDERETSRGIGQAYQSVEPTSPVDNYIWVKADSAPVSVALLPTSKYQTTAPTQDLTVGLLWVDSDSSPLKMYVYSGSAWREIGA
jgi:hypothetical protein